MIRCSVSAVWACRSAGCWLTGLTSSVIKCSITACSNTASWDLALHGGVMSVLDMPPLAGIHHLKLPVTDLARSREWYQSRLGYKVKIEFVEQGQLVGYVLTHPNGGPPLGLRLNPERALAAAGFDYFAIGVPGKQAMDQLAAWLTALGEQHAGVHWASIGWILPELHDPDGHEVRFYTTTHHSEPPSQGVVRIENPRETAEAAERAMQD